MTEVAYDAADQLIEAVRVDGRTQYRYDAVGRLIEIEESGVTSGRIAVEYDMVDRVVRETHQQGELLVVIEHTWDDLDRRIQRRVAASGPTGSLPTQVTDYAYNNAGRPERITQAGRDTLYQWDEDDRLTQKTLPNGVIVVYSYDDANRTSTITYSRTDSTLIEQLTYQYDAAGRRLQKDALVSPSVPETPFVAQYTNNRMTQITLEPASATPRTYTLAYDNAGNLTSKVNVGDTADRTDYVWDSRDRLVQLTSPGLTAAFEYDSLDRRTSRRIARAGQADVVTYFVYDGMQAVGEIQPSQGATPQQSSDVLSGLMIDELLGRTIRGNEGSEQQAFLTDALGSALAVTRDDQSLLSVYGFSPYGESGSPTRTDSAGYTGREQDGTGLNFYRARYYDPVLKRFIAEDPIGLDAGTNRYAYVEGDPVSNTDPSGNCPWCIGAVIGFGFELVTQLASDGGNFKCLNVKKLLASTALGAVGGGLGGRGLTSGLKGLSRGTKGRIGETLSKIENRLRGSVRAGRSNSATIPGFRTRVDSTWRSVFGNTYYVESKFGTSGLTTAQRAAANALGDAYRVERWGYPFFERVGAYAGGTAGATSGGAMGNEDCGCQ